MERHRASTGSNCVKKSTRETNGEERREPLLDSSIPALYQLEQEGKQVHWSPEEPSVHSSHRLSQPCFGYSTPLWLNMNFMTSFDFYINYHWDFEKNFLGSVSSFRQFGHFNYIKYTITEQRNKFLVICIISFLSKLWFCMYQSFISLVKCIDRCVSVFKAIVNWIAFTLSHQGGHCCMC